MDPKVIVALDFPDAVQTFNFVRNLDPALCRLKVGFELFVAEGPSLLEKISGEGFDIFLDLKFHDIPNTVASACRAASRLGVWMINVHASGGVAMMQAAREAVESEMKRPKLIAVTVLTSMGDEDLLDIGIDRGAQDQALALAELAKASGLDGVVCSAAEAAEMRNRCGDAFLLVTPGIRPADSDRGDQKRVMTPAAAIGAGADYLVIGRPITRAEDPLAVLDGINRDIEAVLTP